MFSGEKGWEMVSDHRNSIDDGVCTRYAAVGLDCTVK